MKAIVTFFQGTALASLADMFYRLGCLVSFFVWEIIGSVLLICLAFAIAFCLYVWYLVHKGTMEEYEG